MDRINIFLEVLFEIAQKDFINEKWENAYIHYYDYYNKCFLSEKDPRDMTETESINLLNLIEVHYKCIDPNQHSKNSDFNYSENIYRLFTMAQKIYEEGMMNKSFPYERYFNSYILLGKSSLSYKKYKLDENIFDEGYNKSVEKECDWSITLDLLFHKVIALEYQTKYIDAYDEIKYGMSILEIHNVQMDDDRLITYNEIKRKYETKLHDLDFKISNDDKREETHQLPEGIPSLITYHDHVYKNFYNGEKYYEYICQYGYNRHKTNKIRCKAKIGIPKSYKGPVVDETVIVILQKEHVCDEIKNPVIKVIQNANLKSMMEEIFLSSEPKPTLTQMISMLYKKIEAENTEGHETLKIDEKVVKSFYPILLKKYKKEDSDFPNDSKNNPPCSMELFKIRFRSSQDSRQLIICYCSEFQKSCVKDSHYVFIDGTFSITPENFAQVLVIMAKQIE